MCVSGWRYQHCQGDWPLSAQQRRHPHLRWVEETSHGGGEGEKWAHTLLKHTFTHMCTNGKRRHINNDNKVQCPIKDVWIQRLASGAFGLTKTAWSPSSLSLLLLLFFMYCLYPLFFFASFLMFYSCLSLSPSLCSLFLPVHAMCSGQQTVCLFALRNLTTCSSQALLFFLLSSVCNWSLM